MLVLEAGYAHAVLQNVDIMADGTKASSLSRTLSKQHNVKHFTLYQHKQKDTPIATNVHPYHSQNTSWHPTKGANTDTKRPPLEAMSGDGCIIEVGKTVNMSSSCNCTRHETKLSILDQALNCAKQNSNTVVELKLKIKQLQLHQTHYFEGHSKIQFTGMSTLVLCSTWNVGMKFSNSRNIIFESVMVSGCGALHNSTSVNFVNSSLKVTSSSAIYLSHCSDVSFTDVNITNSNGTGLTMINCGGKINITKSHFINNSASVSGNPRLPGGGGISIELLGKCSLPECSSSSVDDYSNTKYRITYCNFSNNSASSGNFLVTHITSNWKNYFTYGMGGGLYMSLGNLASNNQLVINNSLFESNTAQRGGGFFVGFGEDSKGNKIIVDNGTFLNNSCHQAELPPGGNFSSGGGLSVLLYTNSRGNNITITSSTFKYNTAYFGGGLSMGGGSDYDNMTQSHFSVRKCKFVANNARIGAALDLYYRVSAKESHHRSSVEPSIYDSNFTQNGDLYHYSTDNATGRTFATIYIVYIPTKFCGTINVINNSASGFGIEEATVQFEENVLINVTNNTAKIGGGIAMIGRSTVVLHENSTVIFRLNSATEKGGAIFSSQSQERYTAYDYTCFIQYQDYNCRPAEWNASILFSDNRANYKFNDIYASSLLPCVWPSSPTSHLEQDIEETFCGWTGSWHFDNTSSDIPCRKLIETAPSRFSKFRYSVQVTPGNLTKIPDFSVVDDLGHNVSASALYTTSKITLYPSVEDWPQDLKITVTNEGILFKTQKVATSYLGKYLIIVLQTADRKSVTTEINVTILDCPPGYKVNPSNCACECRRDLSFNGKVSCNTSSFTSNIFAGYCMTFSNVKLPNKSWKDKLIVARCPYVVGSLTSLYNDLPSYGTYLHQDEDHFCTQFHRTGKLCSECIEGYGLDVYSTNFNCIRCNKTHLSMNWVRVVVASTVPTTILFILCTVFHISITSAPTNGYIFFSHVITMRLDVLTVQYVWKYFRQDLEHNTLSNLLYIPYQIWTFDFPQIFLDNICLGENFKVTYALTLQYLSVLYPLVLVFIAIILIELHAKNFKPLVWLWKPLCYLCVRFRHSWHIRTSVIDTFASFLLLSYSSLIGVSMSLLTPNSVVINNGTTVEQTLNYDTSVEFFKKGHLKFAVFAVIILSTFGALPPLLLILYPFKWFQRLLNRCNLKGGKRFLQVFVDAFQGSYKNNVKGYPERRYFAGVYFLFRIAVNVIYAAVEDMTELHLTLTITYMFFMLLILALRPYKRNFYNILDGIFMAILVTTHAMTVYLLYHALALHEVPRGAWNVTYFIQHIPTIYMILLIVYLISFRLRCVKRFCFNHFGGRTLFFKNEGFNDKNSPRSPLINYDWPSSSSLVIPSPSSPHVQSRHLSDIPDRVENPQRYEPLTDSWQFSNEGGGAQNFNKGGLSKKKAISYGSNYT